MRNFWPDWIPGSTAPKDGQKFIASVQLRGCEPCVVVAWWQLYRASKVKKSGWRFQRIGDRFTFENHEGDPDYIYHIVGWLPFPPPSEKIDLPEVSNG